MFPPRFTSRLVIAPFTNRFATRPLPLHLPGLHHYYKRHRRLPHDAGVDCFCLPKISQQPVELTVNYIIVYE